MKEELLKGLSDEQIAKARNCHSQEELLALAKQEGIELNDEQLEAVSGGMCSAAEGLICPFCGQSDYYYLRPGGIHDAYVCNNCSNVFYHNHDNGEVTKKD